LESPPGIAWQLPVLFFHPNSSFQSIEQLCLILSLFLSIRQRISANYLRFLFWFFEINALADMHVFASSYMMDIGLNLRLNLGCGMPEQSWQESRG